jgi:hypothetical protein
VPARANQAEAEATHVARLKADSAASDATFSEAQAVQASVPARTSAQAITDPANTAITVVAPFSGGDVDADSVLLVANQAKAVGAEQAASAQQRATEALEAARLAQEAADRAAGALKPAYDASAVASRSSADATKSAAADSLAYNVALMYSGCARAPRPCRPSTTRSPATGCSPRSRPPRRPERGKPTQRTVGASEDTSCIMALSAR